ncbi:hypothetical protein Q644_10745 [Brucella intermedia 229E]|uniref:Uncharacterized protein n=1 Tax=Brucella intermedia 229E TaxID=1337887 RepID=U4V369_9HYPH|nr:hypothetical protein Q644_10745 [Brucella intermedia 229E]
MRDLRNVKAIIILILFAGIFRARHNGFEYEVRQGDGTPRRRAE